MIDVQTFIADAFGPLAIIAAAAMLVAIILIWLAGVIARAANSLGDNK